MILIYEHKVFSGVSPRGNAIENVNNEIFLQVYHQEESAKLQSKSHVTRETRLQSNRFVTLVFVGTYYCKLSSSF